MREHAIPLKQQQVKNREMNMENNRIEGSVVDLPAINALPCSAEVRKPYRRPSITDLDPIEMLTGGTAGALLDSGASVTKHA